MIKTPFISLTLRASLVASAFLYTTGNAAAINIDPLTFCRNTCKLDPSSPGKGPSGPCAAIGMKEKCKKICKDDNPTIWKEIASLQMSNDKEFRKRIREVNNKNDTFKGKGLVSENAGKKAAILEEMVYDSPIGRCLGIENPTKETAKVEQPQPSTVDPLAPPPYQAPDTAPTTSVNAHTAEKNELCAAAIRTEMAALEKNKTDLGNQGQKLGEALKKLESTSGQ